jgi:hypothetical protein
MDKASENALAIIGPHKPKTNTTDQPLPLDEQAIDAEAKTITIDLTAFETSINTAEPKAEQPARDGKLWNKLPPLAASLTLATLFGVLAGTAATVTLMPDRPVAPAVAAVLDETLALQYKVAALSGDLAALKSGFDSANRASATQLNKIGERLDRAEKAQAEPAAKLARFMETLDRLERRTAAAPAPEHTGSVTSIEKQQSKPPEVEGWRLRDFYAGRAILENRAGALYQVGPGSSLPGVGKVETIKRVDGKIVITTQKGIITSSLEPPRHPPYFMQRY